MKCPNCKHKNKIRDKFCSECGTKISIFSSKSFILGILVVLFIGVIFFFYQLVLYFTGPKYVALQYFKTVISNNTDSIYEYIDEYQDELFVSKDILADKITLFQNVQNYSIVNVQKSGSSVYVTFEMEEGNIQEQAVVELLEQKIGFLKTYKVVSGKIASNVTIRVLKDSKITVDSQYISTYLSKTEGNYDIYVIPYMIAGDYEVDVTYPNGLQSKETLSVASDQTYTIQEVQLENTVTSTVEECVKKDLNILYKAAAEDKNYEDIQDSFKNNLSSLYKTIKRTLNNSFDDVSSIEFTDVEIKKVSFNEDGNLNLMVLADYKIKYSYQVGDQSYEKEQNKYTYISLEGTYDDEEYDIINTTNESNYTTSEIAY
jgi:hypothetical protein